MALRRVVDNLVRNADLHGRPPVTVELAATAEDAVLTVTDHGPGLPDSLLEHATDRFARADDARSRPGSGLGLSIVHDVVTRAGGLLELTNRPDGFSVTVHLPVPARVSRGPG